MERQQFSHGLLYSIPPGDLSSLHLQEDASRGEFEWEEDRPVYFDETIPRAVLSFLKKTAVAWGLVRH